MQEHKYGEQRFDTTAQAAEWDARYSESDAATWSGRPNGRLVAEVADLHPSRALDVGCGEGADAIWLARRGWAVTAIDISAVAIERARAAGELAKHFEDSVLVSSATVRRAKVETSSPPMSCFSTGLA